MKLVVAMGLCAIFLGGAALPAMAEDAPANVDAASRTTCLADGTPPSRLATCIKRSSELWMALFHCHNERVANPAINMGDCINRKAPAAVAYVHAHPPKGVK